MTTVKIKLRRDTYSVRDGTGVLSAQVLHRRKPTVFLSPFRLLPEEFIDGKAVFISGGRNPANRIRDANVWIRTIKKALAETIEECGKLNAEFTVSDIKIHYETHYNP